MRRKIVAGNWKMNMSSESSNAFLNDLKSSDWPEDVNCIIAPPIIYLIELQKINGEQIHLCGQNCHSNDSGAFTGEIGAAMLNDIGAKYCLVGHSERRSYFNERNDFLKNKVDGLLKNSIVPIYCCGETRIERENGTYFNVVKQQLNEGLFHLDNLQFAKVIIAYEPVWAIGTGLTASAKEAQEMHSFIRETIENAYGHETADSISILYGGSCNPNNAKELFACQDVDGGLIGGASLEPKKFLEIAQAF